MLELAQESHDEEALFTALLGVWLDALMAARHQETEKLVRQMREVAERRKSAAALADAQSCEGLTLLFRGHSGDALTALNRAIALCPDGAGRINFSGVDPLVQSFTQAAACAWAAGYPDRAINFSESAIKRSRDLNQPRSMSAALFSATIIRCSRGEAGETQHLCEQLEALAESTESCRSWR